MTSVEDVQLEKGGWFCLSVGRRSRSVNATFMIIKLRLDVARKESSEAAKPTLGSQHEI